MEQSECSVPQIFIFMESCLFLSGGKSDECTICLTFHWILNQNSVKIMSALITVKILSVLRTATLWQMSDSFCMIPSFIFYPENIFYQALSFTKGQWSLSSTTFKENNVFQFSWTDETIDIQPYHHIQVKSDLIAKIGSKNSIVFLKIL